MKALESYEKDNGYEDDKECYWSDLTDFLQGSILNFCCCGRPEQNLLLIHDLLVMFESQNDVRSHDGITMAEWEKFYNLHQEELKQFVHQRWDDFLYFFWYVMNQKEIMEHGGSVPGWIDDKNFMDAIKKWRAEYKEDGDE